MLAKITLKKNKNLIVRNSSRTEAILSCIYQKASTNLKICIAAMILL